MARGSCLRTLTIDNDAVTESCTCQAERDRQWALFGTSLDVEAIIA
jgi:hypothetical protein